MHLRRSVAAVGFDSSLSWSELPEDSKSQEHDEQHTKVVWSVDGCHSTNVNLNLMLRFCQ